MELKICGMNHHKVMKLMMAQFPGMCFDINDYDPLYIADAIADGKYHSNIGDVEVKSGYIYKNGYQETTMVIGVRNPEVVAWGLMSHAFYRLLHIDGKPVFLKTSDYDQLISFLGLVPA